MRVQVNLSKKTESNTTLFLFEFECSSLSNKLLLFCVSYKQLKIFPFLTKCKTIPILKRTRYSGDLRGRCNKSVNYLCYYKKETYFEVKT